MKEISSSSGESFKVIVPILCGMFIFIGIRGAQESIGFPIAAVAINAVLLTIWWRVILRTRRVYLDDNFIYVALGSGLEKISFSRIVSVRKIPLLRYPPIEIYFKDVSGIIKSVVFIPSFQQYGGYVSMRGIGELVEFLVDRVNKANEIKNAPGDSDKN